ncbi:uracil-DNA glycosylase family protein [Mesobacillus jeotgali]|uniref:uracil-DNA glycosylase family protein n=1 Tax=Mesobacillus jeotgali TaxID=129985 RepID=UPI0009A8769C|nr:uracil-DNA glycosylase family protein [Mesobacillus jeotgali]
MAKLNDYIEKIAKLPLKERYSREDLLTKDFLLANSGSLDVYYCTHNEYINPNAKIFIVGITPGFQQMSKSITVARHLIEEHHPVSEILYQCKREARFSGILRKNIIEMLDELDLHKYLSLNSSSELFAEKDYLLHTTSLISFAVFVNGRNYTGHSPKILKSKLLLSFLKEYFDPQAAMLQDALVIPLGKSVEEIMRAYINEGLLDENNILFGFPHPSGANGHRKQQFITNKEKMRDTMIRFFKIVQG